MLHTEYKEAIQPFQAMFPYRETVEKIAKEAFLSFNTEELLFFWSEAGKIYGREHQAYITLGTN